MSADAVEAGPVVPLAYSVAAVCRDTHFLRLEVERV
jgi:hypothetical protein